MMNRVDEIAAAASILMGQTAAARPVIVGRGVPYTVDENASIARLLTPPPVPATDGSRPRRMINVRHGPGPAGQPVEVVERKGLGHPDTLADALAERMSVAYSRHCLERFGAVLHHNLDKLYLRGGHCQIGLGTFEMTDPVTLTIGGRVSSSFSGAARPLPGAVRGRRPRLPRHGAAAF